MVSRLFPETDILRTPVVLSPSQGDDLIATTVNMFSRLEKFTPDEQQLEFKGLKLEGSVMATGKLALIGEELSGFVVVNDSRPSLSLAFQRKPDESVWDTPNPATLGQSNEDVYDSLYIKNSRLFPGRKPGEFIADPELFAKIYSRARSLPRKNLFHTRRYTAEDAQLEEFSLTETSRKIELAKTVGKITAYHVSVSTSMDVGANQPVQKTYSVVIANPGRKIEELRTDAIYETAPVLLAGHMFSPRNITLDSEDYVSTLTNALGFLQANKQFSR